MGCRTLGDHGDGLTSTGVALCLHWKEKALCVFCLDENFDKAGVLCWHLLQLTWLVRLGVQNGVNSFVKRSHSLAESQGAFPATSNYSINYKRLSSSPE